MFYHCIFLIYILFSYFTANNAHKIRKRLSTGGMAYMNYDGIMQDFRNFPWLFSRIKFATPPPPIPLKNCHNNAAPPCNMSEPCSYPCNKIVLTPKNMTKELHTTIDMSPSKKVISAEEILLVPRCPCSDRCATEKQATYDFNVIDAYSSNRGTERYTISYCVQC